MCPSCPYQRRPACLIIMSYCSLNINRTSMDLHVRIQAQGTPGECYVRVGGQTGPVRQIGGGMEYSHVFRKMQWEGMRAEGEL